MLRVLFMILALSGAVSAHAREISFPAIFRVVGVAANDVLNVRQAPHARSPIVGVFAPNEPMVEVLQLSEDGRWGLVRFGGSLGWSSMRYLEPLDRNPQILDTNTVSSGRASEIERVRRAQQALADLGYYTMEIDGVAGPGMMAAVQEYQRAYNIRDFNFDENNVARLEANARDSSYEAASSRRACLVPVTATNLDDIVFACINTLAIDPDDIAANRRLDELTPRFQGQSGPRARALREAIACVRAEAETPTRERLTQCQNAARLVGASADLSPLIDRLAAAVAEETARAEAERLRLASENARVEGRQLLADIADFLASGARFDAALNVARATATVQAALTGQDDRALVRDYELLTSLVANEPRFAAFLNARSEAEAQARARAVQVARQDMERSLAFIEDYVATNMLDRRAPDLLTTADGMRDALAGTNEDQIVSMRNASVAALRRMSLWDAAQAFRAVSSEDETRQQQQMEQEAAIDAAARDARDEGEQLLTDIADFLSGGALFGQALDVARATAALRDALAGDDAGQVVRTYEALNSLTAQDPRFAQFHDARREAEAAAQARAVEGARADLARTMGFIESFVATNMLDNRVSDLLALNDQARAILDAGGVEPVLAGRDTVAVRLRALGVADQAAAWRPVNAETEAQRQLQVAQGVAEDRRADYERSRATEWLSDVEAFVALGRRLANPVPAASLVAQLRSALADGTELSALLAAAEGLTSDDPDLAAYVGDRDRQRQVARDEALRSATETARRSVDFVVELLSLNPLRPEAGALLAISDELTAALELGDGVQIAASAVAAEAQLAGLGLADQLRGYLSRIEAEDAAASIERQRGEDALAQDEAARNRERAEILLSDIDAHVAAGGRFANTLAFARALNALRQAMEANAQLAEPLETLESVVTATESFTAFAAQRAAARSGQAVDALAVAMAQADRVEAFIAAQIEADPLRADLDDLLSVASGIADARGSGDAATTAAAVTDAEAAFARLDLAAAWRAFASGQITADGAQAVVTADNGLSVNALNAALLDGAGGDFMVLANRATAPNLHRSLLGADVFEGGQVQMCWAHPPSGWSVALGMAMNAVQAAGATLPGTIPMCSDAPSDLVLITRSALLDLPADRALPIVRQFEDGGLEFWLQITAEDMAAQASLEAETGARIEAEILAGAREGWGLVALDHNGTSLCVASPEGVNTDAARLALELEFPALALQLPAVSGAARQDTPERIFVHAMRQGCAGIWASTGDLGRLIPALDREGLPYRVTSLVADSDTLEALQEQINAANAEDARSLAALRQELAQNRAVAAEIRRREAIERLAYQQGLRAQYAQEARAAQDRLADLVHGRLRSGLINPAHPNPIEGPSRFAVGANAGSASSRFGLLYPQLDRWLTQQGREQWTHEATEIELEDYGTAQWNDRRLETVVLSVTVEMVNAIRGEHRRNCAVLGLMLDDEFSVLRDPLLLECSAIADLGPWLDSVGFETRWTPR